MMNIDLGVAVIPYGTEGYTTAYVAHELEDRYKVMGNFINARGEAIATNIAKDMNNQLSDYLKTGSFSDTGSFAFGISEELQDMIAGRHFDELGINGVPTGASIAGVVSKFDSAGKKASIATGISRPSFIDTGLYISSIRAKLENEPD